MADARAARSVARAVAYHSARGVVGAETHRQPSNAASTEDARAGAPTRAVQATPRLRSRLPEVQSIITMLEKLYDLERHATAHEEYGQVRSIHKSQCALYHRLENAAESMSHEHTLYSMLPETEPQDDQGAQLPSRSPASRPTKP